MLAPVKDRCSVDLVNLPVFGIETACMAQAPMDVSR
jgi:hypothetical protein